MSPGNIRNILANMKDKSFFLEKKLPATRNPLVIKKISTATWPKDKPKR